MVITYLNVHVSLDPPLKVTGLWTWTDIGWWLPWRKKCPGFYQNVGVTAEDEETARHLVVRMIRDDSPDLVSAMSVEFDEISVIPEEDLQEEIYDDEDIADSVTFTDPMREGIWYRTGRIYYCSSLMDTLLSK